MKRIDWKLVVAVLAIGLAIFAGTLWRRPDVVFDKRAVEIPLSDTLRKSIETALAHPGGITAGVSIAVNEKPVVSSGLPTAKLPDKLLYVNIRNVGHIPSSRIKVRLVVPGYVADRELSDAGSAYGPVTQKVESPATGELSFECQNLANDTAARIRVAVWYQQTKSGLPLVEIQDVGEGPAREVGSVDSAKFYWWDSKIFSVIAGVLVGLLGAVLPMTISYLYDRRRKPKTA